MNLVKMIKLLNRTSFFGMSQVALQIREALVSIVGMMVYTFSFSFFKYWSTHWIFYFSNLFPVASGKHKFSCCFLFFFFGSEFNWFVYSMIGNKRNGEEGEKKGRFEEFWKVTGKMVIIGPKEVKKNDMRMRSIYSLFTLDWIRYVKKLLGRQVEHGQKVIKLEGTVLFQNF